MVFWAKHRAGALHLGSHFGSALAERYLAVNKPHAGFDIWALGINIALMLSKETADATEGYLQQIVGVDLNDLNATLAMALQMAKMASDTMVRACSALGEEERRVANLLEQCFYAEPEQRPSAKECEQVLQDVYNRMPSSDRWFTISSSWIGYKKPKRSPKTASEYVLPINAGISTDDEYDMRDGKKARSFPKQLCHPGGWVEAEQYNRLNQVPVVYRFPHLKQVHSNQWNLVSSFRQRERYARFHQLVEGDTSRAMSVLREQLTEELQTALQKFQGYAPGGLNTERAMLAASMEGASAMSIMIENRDWLFAIGAKSTLAMSDVKIFPIAIGEWV
jgi:hypothetical protein